MKNLDLAHLLVELSGRKDDCIEFVEDRPGHDQRYSVDSTRIYNELQWKPKLTFEDGISETFDWYKANFKEIK
jgi:dTDP-glucose 4,6-dehydratase